MAGEQVAIGQALDDAVRLGQPVQLRIIGRGTVSVYPGQDRYATDIEDWGGLYLAGGAAVRTNLADGSVPPASARPLAELRWRAACHDLHRELGEHAVASHGLMQLQSWPDLPCMPEELLVPVTRICALLWRKPTVGYLVARTLDLPPRQVAVLLRMLQASGQVTVSGELALKPQDIEQGTAARTAPGTEPGAASVPSVVSKLWQRLVGLQPA